MTVANWLAILVPLFTLVGGFLTYTWQKSVDRSEQYRSEKQKIYRGFISAARSVEDAHTSLASAKAVAANEPGILTDAYSKLSEATNAMTNTSDLMDIFAPDPVRLKALEFEQSLLNYRKGELPANEELYAPLVRARSELLGAMRNDLFGSSEWVMNAKKAMNSQLLEFRGRILNKADKQ